MGEPGPPLAGAGLPSEKNGGNSKHAAVAAQAFFEAINRVMVESGHIMRGGTIVDATIINAPSSTKNAEKKRDPEMHQTKKGTPPGRT